MRILFDHSTPAPLRHALASHTVVEAIALAWDKLGNGALLDVAEAAAFEILVTADKNMRHQQSLTGRGWRSMGADSRGVAAGAIFAGGYLALAIDGIPD
jgi:predicted nuclease of predicted toxin-antitoxin system